MSSNSINSRTKAPPMMPAVKSTRASSLLDLPCELRLQIYEAVLIQPYQPVLLVPRPQHPPSRGTDASKDKPSSLAILQTCTKINEEAAPLFYKLNQLLISFDKPGPQIDPVDPEYSTRWEKHGVTNLVGFLGSISSTRRDAIKNIIVELHVKNCNPSSYKNGNFYLAWSLLRAYDLRMCIHSPLHNRSCWRRSFLKIPGSRFLYWAAFRQLSRRFLLEARASSASSDCLLKRSFPLSKTSSIIPPFGLLSSFI